MTTRTEHEQSIDAYLREHFSAVDRGAPYDEAFLNEFLKLGGLHSFVPVAMGGRGESCDSYLRIVEMTAYYSIPLGLTLGIAGSLFLYPILTYAPPDLRDRLIPEFLRGPALGGIMITEPTGGTDIFGLRTTLASGKGAMILNGRKCWGGLTGKAEHWLVAARKTQDGRLTRSVKLVYVPRSAPGVAVNTYFDALGLQPITYGETGYSDVEVPEAHDLTPKGRSALRILYDTLFRSRMGISAIASGLCKRLLDECETRAADRIVFGRAIAGFDQVRFRLSGLRGLAAINRCLRRFTADWMDAHDDLSGDYVLANAIKVVSSESMAAASDSAVQLFASAAYKRNHLVGRAYVDSRPFQIFEGSNDVLYDNIFDTVAGRHGALNPDTINEELGKLGLRMPDELPAGTLAALTVNGECAQRQKIHYGKIVAWIVALGILERHGARESVSLQDARRVIHLNMAARMAELPYLR